MKISIEQELMQTIITKAWENADFKQELITNPIRAIESMTGEPFKLPDGKSIVVRDQTDESIIYLNIPRQINMADMELNEEQLEIIAGGGTLTNPFNSGKKSR